MQKQILKIKKDYPKSKIIVSSRPDDRFSSWSLFRSYHVQPMKKNEVLSLIEKLDYNAALKKKFHERVKKDLYEKNQSFLSNPLLVTIMMITFHQFAEIPHKIHLFYEYAFEALFFRHDASKEAAYNRRKQTGLAMNEFRNLLTTFSMFSYSQERFSFSSIEVLEFIREAKNFERLKVDDQKFFEDLVRAVCILQPEGIHYTFTHRSFQEYFCAVFLTRGKTGQLRDILNWTLTTRSTDNVIQMAFSIAPALIEREWIMPELKSLVDKGHTNTIAFLNEVGATARVFKSEKNSGSIAIVQQMGYSIVFLVQHLYPEFFTLGTSFYSDESKAADQRLIALRGKKDIVEVDEIEFFSATSTGRWIASLMSGCGKLYEELDKRHASAEQTIGDIIKAARRDLPTRKVASAATRKKRVARKLDAEQ